jgi:hypothetical protein
MAIIKPNNNTISAITALPAAISTGKVSMLLQQVKPVHQAHHLKIQLYQLLLLHLQHQTKFLL